MHSLCQCALPAVVCKWAAQAGGGSSGGGGWRPRCCWSPGGHAARLKLLMQRAASLAGPSRAWGACQRWAADHARPCRPLALQHNPATTCAPMGAPEERCSSLCSSSPLWMVAARPWLLLEEQWQGDAGCSNADRQPRATLHPCIAAQHAAAALQPPNPPISPLQPPLCHTFPSTSLPYPNHAGSHPLRRSPGPGGAL